MLGPAEFGLKMSIYSTWSINMSVFLGLCQITKNTDLNLKDLNARSQSVLYSLPLCPSSVVYTHLPRRLVLWGSLRADKYDSSAFSSSDMDHDFNIPKKIDSSE